MCFVCEAQIKTCVVNAKVLNAKVQNVYLDFSLEWPLTVCCVHAVHWKKCVKLKRYLKGVDREKHGNLKFGLYIILNIQHNSKIDITIPILAPLYVMLLLLLQWPQLFFGS